MLLSSGTTVNSQVVLSTHTPKQVISIGPIELPMPRIAPDSISVATNAKYIGTLYCIIVMHMSITVSSLVNIRIR